MLSDVFISAMQRESIKESDPYDWEKETSDEDSVNALKTTLALAGITGMTTRADLVNQSQKNALGATLAAQSLMTPYGDNNNLLQGSNTNNNNNQLKDHMSSNLQNQTNELNNNNNNNLDSSFNYNDVNMNGDKSNNNQQSAKKIPKSLDRNARSKRNIASIIPPASSIDRESQSQSQQQQRKLEQQKSNSAKQSESNNNNNKAAQNNDNSTSAKNLISAAQTQKPSTTKTQTSTNQAYAPTPSAVAAAAAVVQNAASLAAGATSSNALYQTGSSGNQQQQRLSMMQQKQSSQNKQPSRKEDSQASLSVGSESKNSNLAKLNSLNNNNAIAHQPIIMNPKQTPSATNNTSPIGGNSGLSVQSNTPTTAGIALATAYNNTLNNNNNNNNNNKSSSILGSSQASYSYSNSYARPNTKLNNSVDFTTPIGVTSSTVYQSPQYDMDLYQQNDSGIAMSATPNPTSLNSALSALGNLKPPKTPVRMYSRDRSNHSSSVVYPIKNNESTPSLAGLSHGHLSRRSISNNNNNSHNLSILDSDAQSLPQGTFAIKAGPQTIMSQWVVTLDDGDEDEDDDDGEDPEEVDVVDDVVNYNRLG